MEDLGHSLKSDRSAWNRSARGTLLVFFLMISGIFTFLQTVPFLLVLAVLHPSLQSVAFSYVSEFWNGFTVTLCEHLLGIKVVTSGDRPVGRGAVLLLMNHRSRLDWLFFYCYQARLGSLSRTRITLKAMLKHVPGAGWGIQMLVFLFLKRVWEEDRPIIDRTFQYYNRVGMNPQLLLFPEGTDLTPNTKEKSDKFAVKNNLPNYENVLHPRTTGFSYIVQKMRTCTELTEVVDITIGYPRGVCRSEKDLVIGCLPREVHFHSEVHQASALPHTAEELDTWCKRVWAKKERTLAIFNQSKQFPNVHMTSDRYLCLRKIISTAFWLTHLLFSIYTFTDIWIFYAFSLCLIFVCDIVLSGFDHLVPHLQTVNENWLFQRTNQCNKHKE